MRRWVEEGQLLMKLDLGGFQTKETYTDKGVSVPRGCRLYIREQEHWANDTDGRWVLGMS